MNLLCKHIPMSNSKQITSLVFRVSISITVFGALFQFISTPFIILGAAGMVISHSIQFLSKKSHSPLNYSRYLLIVSFSCSYVFSFIQFAYSHLFTVMTKVALIVFLLLYIKQVIGMYHQSAQNNLLLQNAGTEKLSYILADLAIVYVAIASLFKILHWEIGILNANVLLVIGLFTALVSILAGSKIART